MAVHFIHNVNSRKDALATLPIAPCKIVKVCGGYAWFDTMDDYRVWAQQK
jgi:hypothetical protein